MVFCRSLKTILIISLIIPVLYLDGYAMTFEDIPVLRGIVINGDSLLSIPVNGQVRPEIKVNRKFNNISFELEESDSLFICFFLKALTGTGVSGPVMDSRNIQIFRPGNTNSGKIYGSENHRGEEHLADLKILPVWYFSPLAFIIYTILTGLIIWTIYSF